VFPISQPINSDEYTLGCPRFVLMYLLAFICNSDHRSTLCICACAPPQDGHLSEVYMLAFQKDGALVASGDFAGVGAVWDLRCGKKVAKKEKSKTGDPLRAYWRWVW